MITSAVPDPCKVDSAAVVVVEVAEVRCCLVARETIPFALREGPQVRFAGAVPEIRELTKDTVSSWVRLFISKSQHCDESGSVFGSASISHDQLTAGRAFGALFVAWHAAAQCHWPVLVFQVLGTKGGVEGVLQVRQDDQGLTARSMRFLLEGSAWHGACSSLCA